MMNNIRDREKAKIVPPEIQGIAVDELQVSQSQTKMFFCSDSFFVTNPCKSVTAFFAVQYYCNIIQRLVGAVFKLLVRGGITIGNFYICDNILFGPAFAEACATDVNGTPPRILVSETLNKEIDLAKMYVFSDIDGRLCLDMFGLELAEILGPNYGEQELKEALQKQRDNVMYFLNKYSKTKYVSEYLWHVMTFNQHVMKNGATNYPEIAREYLINIPPENHALLGTKNSC